MNRHADIKRESEPPAELESQFILRIPSVHTVNNMSFNNLKEIYKNNISICDQLVAIFISYALSFISRWWQYKQYIW